MMTRTCWSYAYYRELRPGPPLTHALLPSWFALSNQELGLRYDHIDCNRSNWAVEKCRSLSKDDEPRQSHHFQVMVRPVSHAGPRIRLVIGGGLDHQSVCGAITPYNFYFFPFAFFGLFQSISWSGQIKIVLQAKVLVLHLDESFIGIRLLGHLKGLDFVPISLANDPFDSPMTFCLEGFFSIFLRSLPLLLLGVLVM